jgi:hypothetical protein
MFLMPADPLRGQIFFLTKKVRKNGGSPLTLYDFQQLGHGMLKLGIEK